MSTETKKQPIDRVKLMKRYGDLVNERSSWITHWQEISSYILPRNGRYFTSDRNQGTRRHNQIYDNTGTRALKTLGAGLMAGATSPARPWFRLSTNDPDLNRVPAVKEWLAGETRRMMLIFQKSNTYKTLHTLYEEIGAFGTAATIVTHDFDTVIRHYPLTCGEYCIANDWKGDITTLYRRFDKTVGEVVREFGYDKCSRATQTMYDNGVLDKWITIIHAIEPRYDRNHKSKDNKNMAWGSYYFEMNGVNDQKENKFLRESGFRAFPALVPRWATSGGDIYGNGPGMEALGDIKQLQLEQLRKSQGIDYQTNPPLQAPTAMKDRNVDLLPGGITFADGQNSIKSMFDVNLRLDHLLTDIQDVRGRIKEAFYADLFLMISQAPTDGRMTATEVAERSEEKLLMLGPVIERLHNELLSPLVDTTFSAMVEAGIIAPPPDELQGMELNVEFVSMLAQAQQAIGTNAVDRFTQSLGVIAQMKPDVLDKFNSDEWADRYSDMLGVDPKLIVPGKQVAMLRDARAKAQAAQQQVAAMEQQTKAIKNMAESQTGDSPNALTDIINQFSGYGSPSPSQI